MAINLRLSPEQDEQLASLARLGNLSKQQVLVGLIKQRWKEISARQVAEEMLSRILDERKDLMNRLSQA